MRLLSSLLLACICSNTLVAELIDIPGISYELYLPKGYDAAKTYRLVVMVHGTDTSGRMGDAEAKAFWARNHMDVIVAGPNFSWGNGAGKEKPKDFSSGMETMLKDLRQKHKLHDKFVLLGASAGAAFVRAWTPKNEDRLLMMMLYLSGGGSNYIPKTLPVGGACGSMETFAPALKTWAEKVNAAGGYAMYHVAPGVGHKMTDSMRSMTVDLYEKCSRGLPPREMERVEAMFDEAKKLEESEKFKEAAAKYKALLATKGLPDDLRSEAMTGQSKAVLADMAKTDPQIVQTWENSRSTTLSALKDYPGLLEFRKILDEQRRPFRTRLELDVFFGEAELAGQVINQVNMHLKDVENAKEKGGKGPAQILLNKRIGLLLPKINTPEIREVLNIHLSKLPEPVGP